MQKSFAQVTWDFVGIPFRLVVFDQAWLPRFGLTTLEKERLSQVLPHVSGKLLDIGSGMNTLVRLYGDGIGVDVYDWGNGTTVVEDTSRLPFECGSFDTVTCIASLNHIPNRQDVLREIRRLLNPDGKLIITMINPLLGDIGHKLWWYDEHHERGGMEEGEVGGLWKQDVVEMCGAAGFNLCLHRKFVYGMNNLYIFKPAAVS